MTTASLRPSFLRFAALLCCAAAAEAQPGKPAIGVMHYTMYQSGIPNVLKLTYTYDGDKALDLGVPTDIASLRSPRGIVKSKDGRLLVASNLGYLHSVDASTGDVTTQAASNADPTFVALTTSETVAWTSNIRGELFRTPVIPMSTPAPAVIQGSETRIQYLFFRDEHTAFYATDMGTHIDTIFVGVLDTRTMVATRWLKTPGHPVGITFDPYTKDLIICGTTRLIQVDTALHAVRTTRDISDTYVFRSCTVDGEGHILLNDSEGKVSIIDYSKSRYATDPNNPSARRLLHAQMGHIAPLTGPGAIKVKPPAMKGFRAAYADANGDGRIDEAIVELPRASIIQPSSMSLIDPITRGSRTLDATRMEFLDAMRFRVAFPDTQMEFGTAFAAGTYAAILADTALFDATPFEVRDSVGPQLLTAESIPPQRSGDRPVLNVTFSEAIKVEAAGGAIPFQIFRDGADIVPRLRMHSAAHKGGNAWRFEFSSPDFPKGGDSIVVIAGTPLLGDDLGNRSNQVRRVPITGVAPPVFAVAAPINAPVAEFPVPAGSPPVRSLLAADETQPTACLNCPPGPVQQGLQAALHAPSRPGFQSWLFTVRTLGPFSYDLHIYSHLGQYIGRVQGAVDEAILSRTAKDKEGVAQVRLYWWPVTESGSQARTGAYIARGIMAAAPLTIPSPLDPAVQLQIPGKSEKVSLRFGRL